MSLLQDIQKLAVKKKEPNVKPGTTVRVHQKIKEGEKERVQIFEGLVIKVNSGFGADKTFTVRKVVGGIGVEKIFPMHSGNIIKIEVKKKSIVRRAKLYYMRKRSGKSARLKETFISDKELQESIEELAEQKAQEKEEKEEQEEQEVQKEQPEAKEEQTETNEQPETTEDQSQKEEK